MNEILGIAIENVKVFKNGDEIMILHRSPGKDWNHADSLLTFTVAVDPMFYEVSGAVNRAMNIEGLDWDQDFEVVFKQEAYRRAVMNVPNFLMGV